MARRPGKSAVKAMFTKFRKYGPRISVRALLHSVEQNYVGVFPEKMTRENAPRGGGQDNDRNYDNAVGNHDNGSG